MLRSTPILFTSSTIRYFLQAPVYVCDGRRSAGVWHATLVGLDLQRMLRSLVESSLRGDFAVFAWRQYESPSVY